MCEKTKQQQKKTHDSKTITPNDQTSDLIFAGFPRINSGAAYNVVAAFGSSPVFTMCSKSINFAFSPPTFQTTMKFCGFRSVHTCEKEKKNEKKEKKNSFQNKNEKRIMNE